MQKLLLLLGLLLSFSVQAIQHYKSGYQESSWEVKSSPLYCELMHKIPDYGDGRFVYSSGGELAFQLHSLESAPMDSVTSLYSIAPFWRKPGKKELAQLTISKGRMPVYVGGNLAKRMLYELQAGHHPTFHYKDWAGFEDDVLVEVTSVNFHKHLTRFRQCISDALPYGPDQVKDTAVFFAKNKDKLSPEQQKRLKEISLYASLDNTLKIELGGHADARGRRIYNRKLSSRRNKAVEMFLLNNGVPKEQIVYRKAYGESRPKSSNRTEHGRKDNRRVDVMIKRD